MLNPALTPYRIRLAYQGVNISHRFTQGVTRAREESRDTNARDIRHMLESSTTLNMARFDTRHKAQRHIAMLMTKPHYANALLTIHHANNEYIVLCHKGIEVNA